MRIIENKIRVKRTGNLDHEQNLSNKKCKEEQIIETHEKILRVYTNLCHPEIPEMHSTAMEPIYPLHIRKPGPNLIMNFGIVDYVKKFSVSSKP